MIAILAVGVPGWPRVGRSWDFVPLVAVAAVLLTFRLLMRVRLTPKALAIAFVLGTLVAWGVGRYGAPPAVGVAFLLAVAAAPLARPRAER